MYLIKIIVENVLPKGKDERGNIKTNGYMS